MTLQEFLSDHVLHWAEALGLIGKLYYAVQHLVDTIAWSQVSGSITHWIQRQADILCSATYHSN
jgi:hypothetical protein